MLTTRQENFCLKYVELGCNGGEAVLAAGYNCKPSVAYTVATENLKKPQIAARIAELRQRLEDATIMDVRERRQRLSEIARANLTDYVTETGIKVDGASPNRAALAGMQTKIVYHKKGREPEVVTDVKLHDPVRAIDTLNRMDKIYSDAPGPTSADVRITTFVFNLPDGTRVTASDLARMRALADGNRDSV